MNFAGYENLEKRWPDYRTTVERWGLRHFAADEFIGPIYWPDTVGMKLPEYWPPYPEIVGNMQKTAVLADEIRHRWGAPVEVIPGGGWRPPMVNDTVVDGSDDSMHLNFRALDLRPVDDFDTREWIEHVEKVVAEARKTESFAIGLGRYWQDDDRFVHVDTGFYDHNRNWHIPDDPR